VDSCVALIPSTAQIDMPRNAKKPPPSVLLMSTKERGRKIIGI